MNVLVLGIGNILLSDEGVGIRVVAELLEKYILPRNVEIIDGGTMGLDLLPYIEGRSHLLVVDAVKSGKAPGTTIRTAVADPPAFFRNMLSPHQIGLGDVLAVAAMTDELPKHSILFGIEPERLTAGLDMSPEVEAKVPVLTGMLVEELLGLGLPVTAAADSAASQLL